MRFDISVIICIIAFAIISCGNPVKTNISQRQSAVEGFERDSSEISAINTKSGVEDIFSLKLSPNQIDSIFDSIENRYTDDFIFGGVTKTILNDFFSHIDKDTFIRNLEFSKSYEFHRYPSAYKSNIDCGDAITLTYNEDEAIYRLEILNSFYVEDFGCSEHNSYYTFRIVNNRIELIDIVFAG